VLTKLNCTADRTGVATARRVRDDVAGDDRVGAVLPARNARRTTAAGNVRQTID